MRTRVLTAALVVILLSLVFAPAVRPASASETTLRIGLIRVRPMVLMRDHKLSWGICLPEYP